VAFNWTTGVGVGVATVAGLDSFGASSSSVVKKSYRRVVSAGTYGGGAATTSVAVDAFGIEYLFNEGIG
jgi:hypothetical protein